MSLIYKTCSVYDVGLEIWHIRTSCEISSKLQTKAPQRRHLDRSGVFIVNFVHTFHPENI